MNKQTCGIYKITNIKNKKIYIGSSKNILKRWGTHIFNIVSNKHHNTELLKDFKKYGIENFVFQIIKILDSDKNLLIEEQYYIDLYDSKNPSKGYNKSNTIVFFEENFTNNEINDNFSKMQIYNPNYLFSRNNRNQKFNFMSFNWFKTADKRKIDEIRRNIYNVSRNHLNNIDSKNKVWTTFFQNKEELCTQGIVRQYNYLYNPKKNKTNKALLVYANIFPNAFDTTINRDKYAKIILKEFIYNNVDLNKEFIIHTPINRIRNILKEIKNEQN